MLFENYNTVYGSILYIYWYLNGLVVVCASYKISICFISTYRYISRKLSNSFFYFIIILPEQRFDGTGTRIQISWYTAISMWNFLKLLPLELVSKDVFSFLNLKSSLCWNELLVGDLPDHIYFTWLVNARQSICHLLIIKVILLSYIGLKVEIVGYLL